MEVLKRRLMVVIAAMAALGVAFSLRPLPALTHRTEAWLLDAAPVQIDGYRAIPGPGGVRQTYRMPAESYRILQPYGIASMVFTNGTHQLDVCVIASNNRESFHDPMYCFPSQNWTILSQSVQPVVTSTRGILPFSVMQAKSPNGPTVLAAYVFKGPRTFVPTQADLYMQWSLDQFLTGQPREGAIYRFVGDENLNQSELLTFAAHYMDAIKLTSKGVL